MPHARLIVMLVLIASLATAARCPAECGDYVILRGEGWHGLAGAFRYAMAEEHRRASVIAGDLPLEPGLPDGRRPCEGPECQSGTSSVPPAAAATVVPRRAGELSVLSSPTLVGVPLCYWLTPPVSDRERVGGRPLPDRPPKPIATIGCLVSG